MRARSWFAAILAVILLSLCARVWADPPRPQATWRVYLPLMLRRSALTVPTPGPSPSATATSRATSSATPPGAPTRTATPSATRQTPTPTATATQTPTPQPCQTVPRPMAPANGVVLDTLCPLVRFDAGNQLNASRFELQISPDGNFEVLRFSATSFPQLGVNEFQVHRNLDAGAKFYWRVRLRCGEEYAPWSDVWSFTTGSGGTFAPAPSLTSPISGTLFTSWPVRLSWSAVAGALEYQALWRKASAPGITYSTWTAQTGTAAWGLEPGTLYEWSVATRNAYGIGPASAWWQFTTPSTQPAPEDVLPLGEWRVVEEDGHLTTRVRSAEKPDDRSH